MLNQFQSKTNADSRRYEGFDAFKKNVLYNVEPVFHTSDDGITIIPPNQTKGATKSPVVLITPIFWVAHVMLHLGDGPLRSYRLTNEQAKQWKNNFYTNPRLWTDMLYNSYDSEQYNNNNLKP